MLQHLHYLRHGTVTILTDEKINNDQLIFEADIKRQAKFSATLASSIILNAISRVMKRLCFLK